MKRRSTQTNVIVFTADDKIDFSAMGNVIDFALKNNGVTDAQVTVNSGGPILINAGDTQMTYAGYWNSYRRDIVQIAFTGGAGRMEVQFTVDLGACDFDIQ